MSAASGNTYKNMTFGWTKLSRMIQHCKKLKQNFEKYLVNGALNNTMNELLNILRQIFVILGNVIEHSSNFQGKSIIEVTSQWCRLTGNRRCMDCLYILSPIQYGCFQLEAISLYYSCSRRWQQGLWNGQYPTFHERQWYKGFNSPCIM